jgi:hypothetical protein
VKDHQHTGQATKTECTFDQERILKSHIIQAGSLAEAKQLASWAAVVLYVNGDYWGFASHDEADSFIAEHCQVEYEAFLQRQFTNRLGDSRNLFETIGIIIDELQSFSVTQSTELHCLERFYLKLADCLIAIIPMKDSRS